MKTIRKLFVLGRATHYGHAGRLYAYTPYARELDLWAELFPEVLIAGTYYEGPPPGHFSAFARTNIRILPVTEAGGHGFGAKFLQALKLPGILRRILPPMRAADAIHVRGPSDLGLLGMLFGPLFRRPLVAKYATQWQPFPGEPWAWRWQRRLLRSRWWRGPVTVYGRWPDQPAQVVPFFTSMLSETQMKRACAAAARRGSSTGAVRVLFVGRLSKGKNVDVLLRALAAARAPARPFAATIVGEGPERASLEALAGELGLQTGVTFTGGLGFDEVLDHYERADVLVLASKVEGWPKAIAEAMAFGVVCIGSARGLVPQMLGEGRGLVVPPGDVGALQAALERVAADREEALRMAERAAAWAQRYTLEGLGEALRQLLIHEWNTRLPPLAAMMPETREATV